MLAVEIIIKIPNELVNVSIVNIARMLGGNFVFEIRKLHLPWHYKDAVFIFFTSTPMGKGKLTSFWLWGVVPSHLLAMILPYKSSSVYMSKVWFEMPFIFKKQTKLPDPIFQRKS